MKKGAFPLFFNKNDILLYRLFKVIGLSHGVMVALQILVLPV